MMLGTEYTESGMYIDDEDYVIYIQLPTKFTYIHEDELDEYYIIDVGFFGRDTYERKEGLNRV